MVYYMIPGAGRPAIRVRAVARVVIRVMACRPSIMVEAGIRVSFIVLVLGLLHPSKVSQGPKF